jgi:hypothetical protein
MLAKEETRKKILSQTEQVFTENTFLFVLSSVI